MLDNDTDFDSAHSALTVTNPDTLRNRSWAPLVLNTNGSYTYTPKPNVNGVDNFSYTVSDNHPACPRKPTAGALTITVDTDDPPVITGPPTVGTPNGVTGAVTGSLSLANPRGPHLHT